MTAPVLERFLRYVRVNTQADARAETFPSSPGQRVLLDDGQAMLPIGAAPEFATVAAGVTGYAFDAYDLNAGLLSSTWNAPQRA